MRVKFKRDVGRAMSGKVREESFRFDANAVWGSNEIGERSKFFKNEEEAITYLVMCP
jgi:hypothetical protein